MLTIEKLDELGCDTSDGLKRCMDDREFYLSLVPGAFDKKRYEALEKKINEGDLKNAFEDAHALKGVLSNLAITPLFDVINRMTELLRAGEKVDYGPLIAEMWEVQKKFEINL